MADNREIPGLAESGAPIAQAPEPDMSTPEGLALALGKKLVATHQVRNPQIRYIPPAAEGKEGVFVVLTEKKAVTPEALKALGFGDKPKIKEAPVESWEVPATIMKKFDPKGEMDSGDLGKAIRALNTDATSYNGMDFVSVTGDWDKGFTISNVAGGSRSAIFGKEDAASIDKRPSKVSTAIIVSEKNLRAALEGKNEAKAAAAHMPPEPEITLDALAALAQAERAAPTSLHESYVPLPAESGGGFLGKFFGGRKGGKER